MILPPSEVNIIMIETPSQPASYEIVRTTEFKITEEASIMSSVT